MRPHVWRLADSQFFRLLLVYFTIKFMFVHQILNCYLICHVKCTLCSSFRRAPSTGKSSLSDGKTLFTRQSTSQRRLARTGSPSGNRMAIEAPSGRTFLKISRCGRVLPIADVDAYWKMQKCSRSAGGVEGFVQELL